MIKTPSRVVKAYLHGARKEFHSPAKMYAVVLFFSIVVFSNTGNFVLKYEEGLSTGFSNNISIKQSESASIKKAEDQEKINKVMEHFERNFKTYLQLFFLSWIPISAFFLWVFFGYRKFTFGETLVASGYFSSLTLLLSSLNEVLTYLFPNRFDKGWGLAEAVGIILYYYLVRKIYFRPGRRFHLRVLGFTLMSVFFYIAVVGVSVVWAVKSTQ